MVGPGNEVRLVNSKVTALASLRSTTGARVVRLPLAGGRWGGNGGCYGKSARSLMKRLRQPFGLRRAGAVGEAKTANKDDRGLVGVFAPCKTQ
jgi:hypothetical protein